MLGEMLVYVCDVTFTFVLLIYVSGVNLICDVNFVILISILSV